MKPVQYSIDLPIDKIKVSPFHFRKETAQEHLDDLAQSILEVGLIHAVSVVKDPAGGYELVNGHRRLLAHRRGKLKTIRANIYEYEPEELADERVRQQAITKFLLAANSSEPLIPVERARYYMETIEKFGWEPADIARVHHVTEASVLDDLMYMNLTPETLDLVQAHMESFSTETLKVLAEYSTPSAAKAWTMTAEEQVAVAKAIALQQDKRLVESARALKAQIREVVGKRRENRKAEKRRLGSGGEDPVKTLFKIVEATRKQVDLLVKADLTPVTSIVPSDKGAIYLETLTMAQHLMQFADGPIQGLKVKGQQPPKPEPKEPLKLRVRRQQVKEAV